MKITVTHRDTGTMPRMLGNNPLAGSGRCKVGEIVGRKEKKTLCSPFFFIQTLQRSDIKLFPPSCNQQRAETTQIKSIRKILSKGNNHLNHRTLAGRRGLEEHQERSKDNDTGQQIRYGIAIQ